MLNNNYHMEIFPAEFRHFKLDSLGVSETHIPGGKKREIRLYRNYIFMQKGWDT